MKGQEKQIYPENFKKIVKCLCISRTENSKWERVLRKKKHLLIDEITSTSEWGKHSVINN